MKKQFLWLSLAVAAMLAGCSKNDEPGAPDVDNTPATEITAKAFNRGSIDTKAPVDGTSLNGLTADVYALTTKLSTETTPAAMFTNAYGRGTMTFDDAKYVSFDKADFSGKSLLPQDGTAVYLYGFYPKGWTIAASVGDAAVEALSMAFDGSKDLMSSYLKAADDVKIEYGKTNDKGELLFKHLLTRYNIQVKAESADAATAWGSVKSVAVKGAATMNNVVEFQKTDVVKYKHDAGKAAPAFFKLTGTPAAPTYPAVDTKYEAADFASSQALSKTVFNAFDNACYAMISPVTVDADKTTAELTLEVVTIDKVGGKETKSEVKVSLDQSKFTANANSTRGYSITITLNFRAGAIQAIASVEEWKDGGQADEDVDGTTPAPPKIGDLKDGGIIYWIDAADAKKYKVVSVTEAPSKLEWAAKINYVIGSSAQSDTDGKGNAAAIKAYFDANPGGIITETTFDAAFPAAAWCYNYKGKDGSDAVGTWYLPAKTDLQYLWCAFNGKAPISWGIGTYAGAPADAAAQAVFNKYLTDAGGANITTSGSFWSGTELSNNTSDAWYVYFSNGSTDTFGKGNYRYVRCVRDL